MTTQTPATAEIEKWLLIRVKFCKFLTPGPDPKEKLRILPESTPAIRIRSRRTSSRYQDQCYVFFGKYRNIRLNMTILSMTLWLF